MSVNPPFDPRAPGAKRGPLPRWSPHLLRRLLRRPALYWSAALLLAAASAIVVTEATAEARRLRADYGATRPVVIVERDIPAGTDLHAATDVQAVPEGLVPASALTELPADAAAAMPLLEGTMVTATALRDERIGVDRGAVAVARTSTTPPATIGTPVILVVAADPFTGVETALIDGVVTAVTDAQLVVSVDRADLVIAGSAVAAGTVVVALSGGPAG